MIVGLLSVIACLSITQNVWLAGGVIVVFVVAVLAIASPQGQSVLKEQSPPPAHDTLLRPSLFDALPAPYRRAVIVGLTLLALAFAIGVVLMA